MDWISLLIATTGGIALGFLAATWWKQRQSRTLEIDKARLEEKLAGLYAQLEEAEKRDREKVTLIEEAQQKLTDTFKALSADALQHNNASFLQLAKTQLERVQEASKGELEKRHQAIGELVTPVRESLEKVDTKIRELEKARVGAYESLHKQLQLMGDSHQNLRKETANLAQALRRPSVRGRWGEMQLQRVVELAGMQEHCDFSTQSTASESRQRPDLIVHLPGNKLVVVDAKAPLSAYLEAAEAATDEERQKFLQEHATQVAHHVRILAQKNYWEQFPSTPEFVVLFLPGEPFLSAALEKNPQLLEEGIEKGVILSTPTTLISLLRAVAYGWRQEKLTENAQQISQLARELYKRLSDMGGHMHRLGRNLTQAVEAYNRTVGSMETRVLVTARKFQEMRGQGDKEELHSLSPIEQTARELQAPEFKDS